jgi:hypothetical protein
MDSSGGFTTPPPPPPPPPGGGQGAGGPGLPQRGIGEILSTAFEIYKSNASSLLMIVAIIVVPLTFLGAFIGGVIFAPDRNTVTGLDERAFGIGIIALLVTLIVGVIINAVLQAALMRGAALGSLGDPVDIDASYKWGFARFGSVLLISILVGLAVVGGFFLLIIGAVIFAVMFSVSIPALVVENLRGTDAMSRSWNLVKEHFWHALGVIVVAGIITGVVSGIIGAIGGDNWFVAWIFDAIAQIITAPFAAIVSVMLYLDLRARREALTADTLRAELNRAA